jgi:hypothetical protein
MARKSKPKFYHEPWATAKSAVWELAFRFGPPKHRETPEELLDAISQWESAKLRAEDNAEWVIRGSKMFRPEISTTLCGEISVSDDTGIIGFSRKATKDGQTDQEAIAKRVVASVNAVAGIVDPEQFIKDVRALLLAYAWGECEDPRSDPNVLGLLCRCIPQEELERHGLATQDDE